MKPQIISCVKFWKCPVCLSVPKNTLLVDEDTLVPKSVLNALMSETILTESLSTHADRAEETTDSVFMLLAVQIEETKFSRSDCMSGRTLDH